MLYSGKVISSYCQPALTSYMHETYLTSLVTAMCIITTSFIPPPTLSHFPLSLLLVIRSTICHHHHHKQQQQQHIQSSLSLCPIEMSLPPVAVLLVMLVIGPHAVRGLTPEERQIVLDTHNKYRAALNATNVYKMVSITVIHRVVSQTENRSRSDWKCPQVQKFW